MTAAFGRLQGESLELRDGLNILQAPNETGKSTWCAFLLAILYGINSRERDRAGFIADKNRYAPWSGVPMSGRMDCSAEQGELTLTRDTRRQTSPMGEFSAVYAGTGEPVPGLTGSNCGEELLGVSREVFARSAFIRQNGLAITQDAELERRIAALISSGEEDTSFTEARDALKRQLNRRRHNKTGQLPALEAERADLERRRAESESLVRQLTQARREADVLAEREAALLEELDLCDRWEALRRREALTDAEAASAAAEQRAVDLRRRIEADRVPENDAIARLRGAIVNLETTRRAVDRARAERDDAMKALLRAEAAVNESPFAGQSPESARKEVQQTAQSGRIPGGVAVRELAIFFLFLAAGVGAAFVLLSQTALSSVLSWLLPGVVFTAFTAAGGVLSRLYRRHALSVARSTALLKRFGTTDTEKISSMVDTYVQAIAARDAAQANANAKSAAADTLYNSLSSNEQGILLEVRRFAPDAFDIPTADQLLRQCAVRRKELSEAESAAREARARREALSQQVPEVPEGPEAAPPARDRGIAAAELAETRARLAEARSAADRLDGQLRAAGDPAALEGSIRELTDRIGELEGEYGALALALEALEAANTALQNRFSPELGRRAAEIFARLTGDRYTGVTLDRQFRLSAEPAGDTVFRDAALLSAGALDQLYLAVRLAICDLVLPPEKQAPLVLDDALASFDDARCAAALRYLKEAAGERQILLFTCHSREADFFAGDGEVFVQRLTSAAGRV